MKKGAIELSANFIVVIVISSVILIGGLVLFYNLRDDVTDYQTAITTQTEENIKSMMLNDGTRVAVFPRQLTLSSGDGEAVGLGITNLYPQGDQFKVTVDVKYHETSDEESVPVTNEDEFYSMLGQQGDSIIVTVPNGEQVVKSILIKIPKGEDKGQYTYTMYVQYQKTDGTYENYDTVQAQVIV